MSAIKIKNLVIFGVGSYLIKFIKILLNKKIKIDAVIPRLDHKESKKFIKELKKIKFLKIIYLKNVNSKNAISKIKKLKPYLICNWGHNQLFQEKLLNIPKLGCINIHPGLLPYGRGSGAIQGEILNNRPLGWTCHFMDNKFDNGEVIAYFKKKINYDNYYYDQIYNKIFINTDKFYARCVMKLLKKKAKFVNKIKNNFGSYYPKFSDGDNVVDWNNNSLDILRKIRSRSPEMLSIIYVNNTNKKYFIKKVQKSKVRNYKFVNGQVIDKDVKKGVLVKTNDNAIWITLGSYDKKNFQIPNFKIGTNFLINNAGSILNLLERINFLEKKLKKIN